MSFAQKIFDDSFLNFLIEMVGVELTIPWFETKCLSDCALQAIS